MVSGVPITSSLVSAPLLVIGTPLTIHVARSATRPLSPFLSVPPFLRVDPVSSVLSVLSGLSGCSC